MATTAYTVSYDPTTGALSYSGKINLDTFAGNIVYTSQDPKAIIDVYNKLLKEAPTYEDFQAKYPTPTDTTQNPTTTQPTAQNDTTTTNTQPTTTDTGNSSTESGQTGTSLPSSSTDQSAPTSSNTTTVPNTTTNTGGTTTTPTVSGGSNVNIPTGVSGNTPLAGLNKLPFPLLNSTDAAGVAVDQLITNINNEKQATYAVSPLMDFKDPFNLKQLFTDPAGTTYRMEDGTMATREELLKSNNFQSAILTGGFTGSITLPQPLQNYKALVDAGIPLDMRAVELLPPVSLKDVALPDFNQFYNNQEGTQIGRGEVTPVDTLQQMPDQSITDITGKSGQ
jgi:hypothetical protein